ncbi:unnamed protein product [Blepharisma stoltei]|uniref:Leucine-rich repeat-containing protein n=1 Tax=Blepharisma stoltei TaxID=1481888 RepID=A0AAU9JXP9_9CILI|nr:unnamed protein product [Blepharisma stoltei]
MSSYEGATPDQRRSQDSDRPFAINELSLSKIENKLSAQQGSSTLNLGDAFIGDEGCGIVAQFLKDNLGVHNVELRGNNITGEGLRAIASALRGQTFVRNLSLEWNNLGNNLKPLAEALAYNESVQTLDIRNNRIGPEGAGYIADLIETNKSLVKIDLRWNDIGASGARSLLSALRKPHAIQSIEVSGNKIPEDLLQQLEQILKGDQSPNKSRYGSPRSLSKSMERTASRDFSDDIHLKLEAQIMATARSESKINELELLLDQEARRSNEMRNDLLGELENEKAKRAMAEEAVMIQKEESFKREMDDRRVIQDLETKLSRANNEKGILNQELENLQEQFQKLQNSTMERYRAYDEKLSQQERLYKQLEETSRNSLDRAKKEHLQEVFEINRDFTNKLEDAEESLRNLRTAREALENENKTLRGQIAQLKSNHQEALTEQDFKIREEETTKFNTTLKGLETRMRSIEESRENLNKRNQDLQREIMQNDKRASEQILALETTINQLREERTELQRQLAKANATIESLRGEVYMLNTNLDRSKTENEELNETLNERKEAHMKQLETLLQEQTTERKQNENTKENLTSQIHDLEMDLMKTSKDRDRILNEYNYLSENLKQKTVALIQETVLAHLRKLEAES